MRPIRWMAHSGCPRWAGANDSISTHSARHMRGFSTYAEKRVVAWGGPWAAPVIDTLRLTAEEAAGLLERKEVSGEELTQAFLDAIDERDEELHAYLHVVGENGAGVPLAHKDLITTKGIQTTAGSRILEGYVPVFDSTVAVRCKEAGLPILGKTNMDEFAMGSSTENSAYGPSHNPWDPTRVPGGSSGGSAAAVAGGLAPWALGSDTGGSIKQPASLCGLVGLRPTYGTVSRYGIVAFASSLDQVGPITKTVRDNARLYKIIAGRDPCDSTTVELPAPVEIPSAEDLNGLRVGVPKELNEAEGIEPGVAGQVQKAIALAEDLGAEVGETTLPRSVDFGLACYYLVAPAEASSNLARYDGVRYGYRTPNNGDLTALYERTRWEGFGAEPKRRILIGTYALSAGYFEAYYGQAQKVRTVIAQEHSAAFESFDLLISPTSPTVAFKLGEKAENPLAMYLSDLLTIPSNMAGLPGLSIPCGLSEGLPVGLQLIGPQFSENLLFRAGHALERAIAFDYVPERLRDA
jgi:aspartyl-tRNA(Asn)/glutamyl-tRNA(Gln) amidotransferase subunit A